MSLRNSRTTARGNTTAASRAPTTASRASTSTSAAGSAPAPTVVFFLTDADITGALTLESARHQPKASIAFTDASKSKSTPSPPAMIIPIAPRNPAPSDSTAFPDPLPSLSAMLIQNRLLAENTAARGQVQRATAAAPTTTGRQTARTILEPFNTLNENDWDELLGVSEPLEDYVSPDISPLFNGNAAVQGNEELEINGREFLSSPPIPILGSVPRVFGDMLVPIHLLDPTYLRPDKILSTRYDLRDKPRTTPVLPSFETIRGQTRAPPAPLRPIASKPKPSAKSARARLFGSPTEDNKENQPVNVPSRESSSTQARQADCKPIQLTGHLAKRPLGSSRGSLDSATTPPLVAQLAQLISKTARKGKHCSVLGCAKGARSKGLCKRHGGGKRCTYGNCTRSDQGGGLCIGHGGGKRCMIIACSNSAQSRGLCKSHGGGKRCAADGCEKSCQGGGFCRSHGSAKLCKASVCFNTRHLGDLCRAHITKAQKATNQPRQRQRQRANTERVQHANFPTRQRIDHREPRILMEDQVLQAQCLQNVVVEERGADGAVVARTELSPHLALKKEMGNARLVSDDAMLWVARGALQSQPDGPDQQRVTLTNGKRSFSFFLACNAQSDAFLSELRAQVAGDSGREATRKRRKIRRQLADSARAGFVPVVNSLASPAKPSPQAPSTPGRRRLSDVSNSSPRLAPPLPLTVSSTVSEAHGVFPSPSKSPFRSPFRKSTTPSPASGPASAPAPRRASPIVSLSSLPPVHSTPSPMVPPSSASATSSASPRPREWLSPARASGAGRVRVQLTPPSIRRDPSLTPASSRSRDSASEKENTPVRSSGGGGGIVNKRVRSLQRMLDDVPREEPEHTAGARPLSVRSPYFLSPTNAREMSPVRRPSPAKKLRSPSRPLGELHQNQNQHTTPPLPPLSANRTPGSHPQSGAAAMGESGLRKVTHGLLNLGNFCYMNAIVQSLAALPGFADHLQNDDWLLPIIRKHLAAKGKEHSSQEIAELLGAWRNGDATDRLAVQEKLALLLQQVIDGSDTSINPEPLKAVMGRRNARFASHFQQDAHEFLLQLVTEYEKELVQAVEGVLKAAGADSVEPPATQQPEPAPEQPPAPKKASLLNFFRLNKKSEDSDAKPSDASSAETTPTSASLLESKDQEALVAELFPAECFRTELYRTLTCCSCKYSRRQVEKFYDFSLDLPFVPLPKSPVPEPQLEPAQASSTANKHCHCGVDAAVIESAGERFYSCAKSACSLRDKVDEAVAPASEPKPTDTPELTTSPSSQPAIERPAFSSIQLSDLLKDQFKSEVLELTCEKCQDGKEATARYEVKSLPRVLVLHLKRFEVNPQTGTLYKRCDLVEAARELFPVQDIHGGDATNAAELGELADKRYTIKSVVHHLGKTVDEGHYVADVCGPRGNWRRRNDTHETLIGEDFALRASRSQESCYMMFYVLAGPTDEQDRDKENLTTTTTTATTRSPARTRSPGTGPATTPDSPASLVGRRREMTPPRRDASKVSKSLHDLL